MSKTHSGLMAHDQRALAKVWYRSCFGRPIALSVAALRHGDRKAPAACTTNAGQVELFNASIE
jgi:hypothetical protein